MEGREVGGRGWKGGEGGERPCMEGKGGRREDGVEGMGKGWGARVEGRGRGEQNSVRPKPHGPSPSSQRRSPKSRRTTSYRTGIGRTPWGGSETEGGKQWDVGERFH